MHYPNFLQPKGCTQAALEKGGEANKHQICKLSLISCLSNPTHSQALDWMSLDKEYKKVGSQFTDVFFKSHYPKKIKLTKKSKLILNIIDQTLRLNSLARFNAPEKNIQVFHLLQVLEESSLKFSLSLS